MSRSRLFAAALCAAAAAGLSVEFSDDYNAYRVTADGETLFSGDSVAVFISGEWFVSGKGKESSGAKSLSLVNNSEVSGTDATLGEYSGRELVWAARTLSGDVRFVARAVSFRNSNSVMFTSSFPDGAEGTSPQQRANATRDAVSTNWPTFTTTSLPSSLSWQGSFVSAVMNGFSTGPTGGPTVFFDSKQLTSRPVVVGGPWGGNWKSFSAGPGANWNGTQAWAPGLTGTVRSVPKGYTQSILLRAGPAGQGVNAAVFDWGEALRASRPTKGRKVADVTIEKVGYQTDNGAYYCFCREKNCSATLIDTLADLKNAGTPMGYLSFQGAGASSLGAPQFLETDTATSDDDRLLGAPWCVNTWGVDGGLGSEYPLSVGDMQRAVDVPLQLYAPYFCSGSGYFGNGSNWTAVSSDTTLEGCGDFSFLDVAPAQSRTFYDWFFAKGKAVGMASFEPDFMNQNYNCVPDFVHTTDRAQQWQEGMAGAALDAGVAVQWCYAAPTDVLAAVDFPAVTNFRVSTDFCYGNSWRIGVSSMLVAALGSAPSKDTLWTSLNGRLAIPGCPWTPDHETPAIELHVMLALLSTGPVGISDKMGESNTTLLRRAVSRDGTLLKPGRAVTAIDATFTDAPPDGEVYAASSPGPAWYFISFKLKSAFRVDKQQLYPQPSANAQLVTRRFRPEEPCKNGADAVASGCVEPVQGAALFTAPAADRSNVTGGTDYVPTLTTVWETCTEGGWTLLGEIEKYVALSPARFSNIKCTAKGVSAKVAGASGERVQVTALRPAANAGAGQGATVVVKTVDIPASGSVEVEFR